MTLIEDNHNKTPLSTVRQNVCEVSQLSIRARIKGHEILVLINFKVYCSVKYKTNSITGF